MDADSSGTSCTPWSQVYNQPSSVMVGDEQILLNCILANPTDDCAARSCAVEGKFIKSVSGWAMFNNLELDTYSHTQGSFDVATQCVNRIGVQSEKQCCGDFPNRFLLGPCLELENAVVVPLLTTRFCSAAVITQLE